MKGYGKLHWSELLFIGDFETTFLKGKLLVMIEVRFVGIHSPTQFRFRMVWMEGNEVCFGFWFVVDADLKPGYFELPINEVQRLINGAAMWRDFENELFEGYKNESLII